MNWLSATSDFRKFLVGVFDRLQVTAPEWLLQSSTPLLLRECVPPPSDLPTSLSFIEASAALDNLLRQAEIAEALEPDEQAEYLALHLRHRHSVSQALKDNARRLSTTEIDRRSALAGLATLLEPMRASLEIKVLDQAMRVNEHPSPTLALEDLTQLGAALDEYGSAVQRIVYPHMSDPMVIPVRTTMNLQDAAGFSYRPVPDPVADARESLGRAANNNREASTIWPTVQQEAARCSPAAMLGEGLTAALSPSRQETILGIYPGISITEKANHLVRNGLVGTILDAMTKVELQQLLEKLDYQMVAEQPEPDLRSVILAALGLGIDSREESSLSNDAPDNAAQILRVIHAARL